MKINSRLFGEIELGEDKLLYFESGLMGFEEYHNFALIFDSEKEHKGGIMWLQSMDEAELAFPVVDPLSLLSDYNPIVEDEWLAPIGDYKDSNDLYVLAVLTVPSDLTKMTANLKAPLIINTDTKKGVQLIVNNDEYQVRFNVYEYVKKLKEVAE